jgi:hypothetical protein
VYLKKDILLTRIRTAIDLYQPEVVGFSAGMTTNVLIYDLFPDYGQSLSLVDFGSVWDVYAGRLSRSYQRRMDVETLREQNRGTV